MGLFLAILNAVWIPVQWNYGQYPAVALVNAFACGVCLMVWLERREDQMPESLRDAFFDDRIHL